MSKFYHSYHLVTESPWPMFMSFSLFFFMIGNIMLLNMSNMYMIYKFNFLILFMIMYQWWRDVIREGCFQGVHTLKVVGGLRMGMMLFILSELMFFVSFFWTYFHFFLSPSIEIGGCWPPEKIIIFNPYNIPLLNTMILLSSGVSVTWSHYMILLKNYNESLKSIKITLFLGVLFSMLQYFEYKESYYTISDSCYGSIFFVATGFHGIHVLMGTIFIFISMIRMFKVHYSNFHHFGFEASSWYWHFVDVIWLFLYIFVYWFSF